MKGDFTRLTQRRRFSGVRLQQGRVQLDADFNEQAEIDARRDRLTAIDAIGACGIPEGASFRVFPAVRFAGVDLAGLTARAVGSGPTALASDDGGNKWSAQQVPADAGDLHAVALNPKADGALAVGQGILRESEGAWASVALGFELDGQLRAVCFGDDEHAWAVGDRATIASSADGGKSWAAQTPPEGVDASLRGVCFLDSKRGWAVGAGGTLIATIDGGASWRRVEVGDGLDADLNAIAFGSDRVGWAVGAGGTIVRTADGGASWKPVNPPAGVAATLRGVAATGPDDVIAVGDGPLTLAGFEAGTRWAELETPEGDDLTAVAVDADLSVAVGELSTVLAGEQENWESTTLPDSVRGLAVRPGRAYVGGNLVEAEKSVALSGQPYLPGFELPEKPGRYLVYLDVWERHLTAVENGELREVALGGPDTATRTQTVWQLRLHPRGPTADCFGVVSDWPPEPATGELRACAEPAPAAAGECMVPEQGGYRRLENQLYRVEVAKPGKAGAASFVWSRDNGAILSPIERIDPDPDDESRSVLVLADPGRDDVRGFSGAGFTVELSNEGRVLRGEPGLQLAAVAGEGKRVTVENPPGGAAELAEFASAATVRRWEGRSEPIGNGWLELEDGVRVQFGAGSYLTGDYWTIPARTIDGSVEWPVDGGTPRFERRHNLEHGYCPLAIVELRADGTWATIGDCRPLFAPLTEQAQMGMAGGDGQELPASGDATLPYPLEAMVMSGRRPVAGARVEFAVEEGKGSLIEADGSLKDSIIVPTDKHGIARCEWRLDRGARRHRVRARPVAPGWGLHDAPVHFNARIAEAGGGGGGPCTVVARPGDDLKEAVERLRDTGGELCLAAGVYELDEPLLLEGLPPGVKMVGRGPATVLRASGPTAIRSIGCHRLQIRHLRIEGGAGKGRRKGEIPAALEILGSSGATVADCELSCPDFGRPRQLQACVNASDGERLGLRLSIERCRLEVGLRQIGILVSETEIVSISDNHVRTPDSDRIGSFWPLDEKASEPYAMSAGILVKAGASTLRIASNVVEDAAAGIVVEDALDATVAANTVRVSAKPGGEIRPEGIRLGGSPGDEFQRGDIGSARITDNSVSTPGWSDDAGEAKEHSDVAGISVSGRIGQFLLVRHSVVEEAPIGVRIRPNEESLKLFGRREDESGASETGGNGSSMWLVAETFAFNAFKAIEAPDAVNRERNFGTFV